MKSLRMSALMFVLGISPLCSTYVHAQQEVDPDHFDRPSIAQVHVHSSKAHSSKAAVTRHQSSVLVASKNPHITNHHQHSRQPARSSELLND